MQQTTRRSVIARTSPACLPLVLLVGCARPGPPKPPSLYVPVAVTDLSASRSGDVVELRFTAPRRASDGVPLPAGDLRGILCRQLGMGPSGNCVTVANVEAHMATAGVAQSIAAQDALPAALTTGPPQLLSYRVEFFNPKGSSLGKSDPAFSIAGAAPPLVEDLVATGARNGIILAWKPEADVDDEVLLQREDLSPRASAAPQKPHPATVPRRPAGRGVARPERMASSSVVWLQANAEAGSHTLDSTAEPDTPYRYRAARRRSIKLGGRTLEVRSALSAPQEITLLEIYPPAVPVGLNTAGYFEHPDQAQTAAAGFAVDLVWQPVDDDSRTAALAGYNVYRETLNAQKTVTTPRVPLNTVPVMLPAFHDNTAKPGERYRYNVTAVDTKGNESAAATKIQEPQPTP